MLVDKDITLNGSKIKDPTAAKAIMRIVELNSENKGGRQMKKRPIAALQNEKPVDVEEIAVGDIWEIRGTNSPFNIIIFAVNKKNKYVSCGVAQDTLFDDEYVYPFESEDGDDMYINCNKLMWMDINKFIRKVGKVSNTVLTDILNQVGSVLNIKKEVSDLEFKNEIESLTISLQKANDERDKAVQERDSSMRTYKDLTEKYNFLMEEHKKTAEEQAANSKEVAKNERSAARYKKKLADQKASFEDEIARKDAEIRSLKADLETDQKQYSEEIYERDCKITALTEQIDKLKKSVIDLDKENETLLKEAEEKSSKISQLETALNDRQSSVVVQDESVFSHYESALPKVESDVKEDLIKAQMEAKIYKDLYNELLAKYLK